MTDELAAAAYVRELFDEPEPRGCIEVPGLLEAADVALRRTTKINREVIVRQLDRVVHTVVSAAGGVAVADLVLELIRLRDIVTGRLPDDERVGWDAGEDPRALHGDRQRRLPGSPARPAADRNARGGTAGLTLTG